VQRAAAGLTGETRSRVPGLGSMRGKHQGEARGTPKPSRAALAARTRRRRLTARWGGSATPATAPRSYGPQARRQAAPASSSPSCATPERHLDGRAAAMTKNGDGGELGFQRLGLGALGAQIRGPMGGGAAYKDRVTALACGPSTEGVRAAAGRTRPGSPSGIRRGEGVIDCRRGRRRSGLAAAAC
jgi:hypothetical protein